MGRPAIESDLADVSAWLSTVADADLDHGPVHVHLDELLGDYQPHQAVQRTAGSFRALVTLLGERTKALKAVAAIPLRDARSLVRREPEISALTPGHLSRNEPPSLTLVRRDAYGRVAMLADKYERAIELQNAAPGVEVWFYRSWWRWEDACWARGVYLEHFLELSPGQTLPPRV